MNNLLPNKPIINKKARKLANSLGKEEIYQPQDDLMSTSRHLNFSNEDDESHC